MDMQTGLLRVHATDVGLRLTLTVKGQDRMRACLWQKDDHARVPGTSGPTWEGFRGDFAAGKVWKNAPPGSVDVERLENFNQGEGTLEELLEVFTR